MPEATLLTDAAVDEDIAADWAAIQEKHATSDESEEAESEEAPENPEASAPAERDHSGRFKPRGERAPKGEETPAEEPQAEGAPEQVAAQTPAQSDQARDTNRAPSSWKPALRAEWEKLSPGVRAEIHRRESDYLKGQHELMPDAQLGRDIRGVVEPYRMMMQAEGATPAQAIGELLRTASVFRIGTVQQKYQEIGRIARQFGIDLRAFAPQPQPGAAQAQGQQFRDPRVDTLVQQMDRERQAREQERQQAAYLEMQQVESTVSRWVNEVDAQGEPLRPYLEKVSAPMARLIPQIQSEHPDWNHSQVMEQAYEQATWAHPEVRPLLQERERTRLEAQRRTENQQRVQAAKRGASVNVPRRAAGPTAPAKPGTMEDTLRETARKLDLIA